MGRFREPSGDSQGTNTGTDDLMKKLFSRSNSPRITYLFLFFTVRTNFKSPKQVHPRDVYGTHLPDIPWTK